MNVKTYLKAALALALVACGQPKQPAAEEVALSGNPVFEGWYADPEGIIYDDTYWMRSRLISIVSLPRIWLLGRSTPTSLTRRR